MENEWQEEKPNGEANAVAESLGEAIGINDGYNEIKDSRDENEDNRSNKQRALRCRECTSIIGVDVILCGYGQHCKHAVEQKSNPEPGAHIDDFI